MSEGNLNLMKLYPYLSRGLAMALVALAVTGDLLPTSQAVAQPVILSQGVEDIGKLAAAKVGDETILAFVKNRGIHPQLTSDDIIYLNSKGVSPAVMTALLQGKPADSAPVTPGVTPPPPVETSPTGGPTVPKVTYYPGGPVPGSAESAPPIPSAAPVEATAVPTATVNTGYFQQQLSPYGSWITVEPYGMVWRPAAQVVDTSWRPYCQGGHWVYTDVGWYWQADDPWGAIVFHYGRWDLHPVHGWIWVPGYNWAPSWVCWRHAPGYYGWAPLPPRAEFVAGVGLRYGGVSVGVGFDFGLGYNCYTFIGYDHLWAHDYRVFLLPRERLEIVFRRSEIHNGYRVDHGRFVVEGFGREHFASHSGRPVEVVSVHRQIEAEHRLVVHNVSSPHNVELRGRVAGSGTGRHGEPGRGRSEHRP
jgi:hypothetical protein